MGRAKNQQNANAASRREEHDPRLQSVTVSHDEVAGLPLPHDPNEDSYTLQRHGDIVYAAVFDGLAGHGDGATASTVAATALTDFIAAHPAVTGAPLLQTSWASDAADYARAQLTAARKAGSNPLMSCTAVVACMQPGRVSIAWCGDSRACRRRANGSLQRLTNDHDFVHDQVVANRIDNRKADFLRAVLGEATTSSEAFHMGGALAKKAFKKNHLMSSELSSGTIGIMTVADWENDDLLLLTSDGVHDNLKMSEMVALSQENPDPQGFRDALLQASIAVARSGEGRGHADDITVVVAGL